MMDKLAMSGYGFYVWTSFGLALLVLIWNEWSARRRHRNVWRDVEVRIKALEDHA
jgi:heme exporter protein CcmD